MGSTNLYDLGRCFKCKLNVEIDWRTGWSRVESNGLVYCACPDHGEELLEMYKTGSLPYKPVLTADERNTEVASFIHPPDAYVITVGPEGMRVVPNIPSGTAGKFRSDILPMQFDTHQQAAFWMGQIRTAVAADLHRALDQKSNIIIHKEKENVS